MNGKIVKISPELKRLISNHEDICEWDNVSVVLFESDGILVYLKEYGEQVKIKYNELKK